MKNVSLLLGFLVIKILNGFSQDMTYNIQYGGPQDIEATRLLYKEINYYRAWHNLPPCTLSPRMVRQACRWGNYMISKHVNLYDNFYEHSYLGPDSLRIPPNTSEILHLIYFDHKPSSIEIVSGLMYGINRKYPVTGWTKSSSHNDAILERYTPYYGASIYVIREGKSWVVYGTVNFSMDP